MNESTESVSATDIAIVGMACRFPGAGNLEDFWRNLLQGVESVSFLAESELAQPSLAQAANYVKAASMLDGIEGFDARFFGYTPKEAGLMDPQQRLFLECAWEALESAGYPPDRCPGQVGVYAGAGLNAYLLNNVLPSLGAARARTLLASTDEMQILLSSEKDFLPARVAYKLNLKGPSVNVQTACSTALTAVHLACQALLAGECDLALAGAATVLTPQNLGYFHQPDMIWSSDGHCRAFDARADGTVFGNGAGVVALKPLRDALADGDPIHAVIKGSAINNDGGVKAGFTAPSVEGQARLIDEALAVAGVDAETVGYIEAHGTGTALGDPVEVAALTQTFRKYTEKRQFCALGSVKTNLGHLGWAAGMAGLIKTVLALKRRQIPPTLHFSAPNPKIDFAESPFHVNAAPLDWPDADTPRRAGVSAFGMGGANAHVILEEAPEFPAPQACDGRPRLFVLSARDDRALQELAQRHRDFLEAHPYLSLAEVCHTASVGRSHFERRAAFVADSVEALRSQLDDYARTPQGDESPDERRGPGRIVFLFTGQGSQYPDMGRGLHETQPAFRQALDRCEEILRPLLGESLLALLYPTHPNPLPEGEGIAGNSSRLDRTDYAQPALFALEYALAELWKSWGVIPDAVLGHSVGEYVAACVAGVFSLEDGLRLIAARGRLMQELPDNGAMAAAAADLETVAAAVRPYAASAAIAAVNAPNAVTISGERAALEAISAELAQRGVEVRPLKVSHAFHSPLMAPMVESFARVLEETPFSPPRIELISNLTGQRASDDIAAPSYWRRHILQPVRFQASVEALNLTGADILLELGPKPTLLGLALQCQETRERPLALPSLRPGQDDARTTLASLGELYKCGHAIAWSGVAPEQGRRLSLPTYPFQRQRYWIDPPATVPASPLPAEEDSPGHPLLGRRMRLAGESEIRFQTQISPQRLTWVKDHRIFGAIVLPGAAYAEAMLAACAELQGSCHAQLESLVVRQSMPLPEDKATTVQIVLRPEAAETYGVEIYSLAAADGGAEEKDEWICHAGGRLRTNPASSTASGADADENLAALRDSRNEEIPVDELYRRFQEQGMEYGPSYKIVRRLLRRQDEVLAEIALPAELGGDDPAYRFHPAILDACTQIVEVAIAQANGEQTFVPIGFERIDAYAPVSGRIWCHARLRNDPEQAGANRLSADLRVFSEDGTPLAFVGNFQARLVSRRTLLGGRQTWRDWLYEPVWRAAPRSGRAEPIGGTRSAPGIWLIFADRAGVGESLRERLRDSGETAALVFPGDGFAQNSPLDYAIDPAAAADYARLFQAIPQLAGVAHLWSLDAPAPGTVGDLDEAARLGCASALHLLQALLNADAKPRGLWLVTQDAQAVIPNDAVDGFVQSPLWGMGRVVNLEYPELNCRQIDLPPSSEAVAAAALCAELLASEDAAAGKPETQIAFRNGQRYVARLVRAPQAAGDGSAQPLELASAERGSLDNLHLRPMTRRPPAPDEVEIRVRASSLNFGDVLYAMDLYPGPNGALGFDCAGVVTAVGEAVEDVRIGDAVATMTPNSFRAYVLAKAALVVRKPPNLGFAEAASIPEAFATAQYCLHRLARLQPGDRILIHAATGGVGMAAVQLAQKAGAEVYATASPGKWETLRSMGVQHIYNSRALDFAEEILADTGGQGVNVLLNSLTGEGYIEKNLAVLAQGGRFVEIGMRDAWNARQVQIRRPDMRYFQIDLGDVMKQNPAEIRSLLAGLFQRFADGELRPAPRAEFPFQQAAGAFRLMQQAKHVGKIVVVQPEERSVEIRPDASYLITGGLGGLGLTVARRLAQKGARHLLLLGRSQPKETARAQLAALEAAGVNVRVVQADVAEPEQVAAALASLDPGKPLAGIVHAAGTLDDGGLQQQSEERFARVLAPKMRGAWNLHNLAPAGALDFFVCFASDSGLLGYRGQANYAAANAFMDAFAHYRRARRLPALAVDWGPWSETGMSAGLREPLARQGIGMIAPEQGLEALEHALGRDGGQIGVLPIDWDRFGPSYASAFLDELAKPAEAQERRGAPSQLRAKLEKAAPRQRDALLLACVQEEVARALGLRETPAPRQGFFALGLDSLMTIDLRNRLQSLLGIPLSATLTFKYPTIQELAEHLAEQFAPAPKPVAKLAVAESAASEAQIDPDADDELDALIGEKFQRLTALLGD
jgi:myxalamid-type polyketide synthase MxaB